MSFLKKMFSSSTDVSYGRISAAICLLYVMGLCGVVMSRMPVPAFPVVDTFWRDIILGLYAVCKTGDTVQAMKGADK